LISTTAKYNPSKKPYKRKNIPRHPALGLSGKISEYRKLPIEKNGMNQTSGQHDAHRMLKDCSNRFEGS
jgi:hypothetical protein